MQIGGGARRALVGAPRLRTRHAWVPLAYAKGPSPWPARCPVAWLASVEGRTSRPCGRAALKNPHAWVPLPRGRGPPLPSVAVQGIGLPLLEGARRALVGATRLRSRLLNHSRFPVGRAHGFAAPLRIALPSARPHRGHAQLRARHAWVPLPRGRGPSMPSVAVQWIGLPLLEGARRARVGAPRLRSRLLNHSRFPVGRAHGFAAPLRIALPSARPHRGHAQLRARHAWVPLSVEGIGVPHTS